MGTNHSAHIRGTEFCQFVLQKTLIECFNHRIPDNVGKMDGHGIAKLAHGLAPGSGYDVVIGECLNAFSL